MLSRFLSISLALLALPSCASETAPTGDVTSEANEEHRLTGFDETALLSSSDGKLVVVHVGETFSKKPVASTRRTPPVVVRTIDAKFHLLYGDGDLVIVDPQRAEIEKTIALNVDKPGDFTFANGSPTTAYVTATKKSSIVKVDLTSGAEIGRVDLSSLKIGTGTIEPRRLLQIGDRLFAQVARSNATRRAEKGAIAVIDTRQDTIEKVIDLEVTDPSGAKMPALEPNLPLVHDKKRNKVFVSALGTRPSNTGMLLRIDPETLAIHDYKKAESGFQGTLVLGEPFSTMFIIYHTSTPTTSSHLFSNPITEDGTIEPGDPGTIVDAFDGLDALALNSAGTLVAMANTCLTGFCFNGAGVNFVDARTKAVLPKLKADKIGFEPMLVQFR